MSALFTYAEGEGLLHQPHPIRTMRKIRNSAPLNVDRSHSDRYEEKAPKSWRGARPVPLSPRALGIIRRHASGKAIDEYLFTNQQGAQLSSALVRKVPLGFRRHALRQYAASSWLRLGTPVHEVAEYLGDEARTLLAVYAHVLGEGQRRDHPQRLATAEQTALPRGHLGTPGVKSAARTRQALPRELAEGPDQSGDGGI